MKKYFAIAAFAAGALAAATEANARVNIDLVVPVAPVVTAAAPVYTPYPAYPAYPAYPGYAVPAPVPAYGTVVFSTGRYYGPGHHHPPPRPYHHGRPPHRR